MHRGLLIRQLRWEDGEGRRPRLPQRRFVHLVDMHLAGWRRPSRRRTGQGLWRSAPGSTGGSSTPACSGTRTSTTVIWRSSAAAPPVRRRLAGRFAAIALASGRPATFLAEHAAVPGVRYLGLYGLQEIQDDVIRVDPRLEAAQPAVRGALEDLRVDPAVRNSGAHLEDKTYSVAVHTRRVPDPEAREEPIDTAARTMAARHGLEVVPGKLVWELRPAVHRDKGDAVRQVVTESQAQAVIMVGDDLGDLPAFAVVAELAQRGYGGIRGAVRSAEAPPALLEAADLVVEGPEGVLTLLQEAVT
jgi:trehalose 6-phosphate phosphatase